MMPTSTRDLADAALRLGFFFEGFSDMPVCVWPTGPM